MTLNTWSRLRRPPQGRATLALMRRLSQQGKPTPNPSASWCSCGGPLQAYTTAGTPADEASVGRLLAIVLAFPPLPAVGSGPGAATSAPSTSAPSSSSAGQGSSSPVVDECARFVASAVKWANK